MSETVAEEKVEEKFIFGNIHNEEVVLPDLTTGARGEERAFKFSPGAVVDLEEFFRPAALRRSHSLNVAKDHGWLIPVPSKDSKVEHAGPRITSGGEAPLNEFDERLAELLDKEDEEERRMRAGQDALGARARRIHEMQKQSGAKK